MNDVNKIKNDLEEFIKVDKFKTYLHLQPAVENTTEADRQFVNDEMNSCAKELIVQLSGVSPKEDELRRIIRSYADRADDSDLDTEDREFCYELLSVLGEIVGIDISDPDTSIEQKLMNDLQRLMKKAGLNPDDFLPPNSSLK